MLCTTIRKMKNISVAAIDRDDPGNQLAVALAVDVHGDRAEHREQEHPEHDRAVEPAPVRRDLVEERLRGIRVPLHVLDGVVVGDEGVDQDGRRQRHQRGDEVERADAALDEPCRPPPRAGDRRGDRVRAGDERGEEQKRSECGHSASSYHFQTATGASGPPSGNGAQLPADAGTTPLAGSYFDGHFAITPFGDTREPVGSQRPLEHDLGAVLERVGNDAGVVRLDDLAVALDPEPVVERVRLALDRLVDDEAVQLHPLAVPRGRLRHHLVDVLVVLRPLAEGGVHQPAKASADGGDRRANLYRLSLS